jgi:hypothetical protein
MLNVEKLRKNSAQRLIWCMAGGKINSLSDGKLEENIIFGLIYRVQLANTELMNAELPNDKLLNAELPNVKLLKAKLSNAEKLPNVEYYCSRQCQVQV